MAIETNELIDVKTLSPFKRFIMTIGNLPTSYLESMSYAEMLAWFCNYLQETVIPTVNNNALAVEELQNLYEDLIEYVNNYFENLDVSEEIDKKLDLMVEDGTLTNLISTYIDPYIQAQNQEINTFKGTVNTRLDAMQDEINGVASGSPKGVYSTLSDLQDDPDADTDAIYLVSADGKWYYYVSGTGWTEGGVYQSSGVGTGEIAYENLDSSLQSCLSDTISYTLTSGSYINSSGSVASNASFSMTSLINLNKGETIVVSARCSNSVCVIGKKKATGSKYDVMALGSDATQNLTYTYTATENCQIACCGNTATGTLSFYNLYKTPAISNMVMTNISDINDLKRDDANQLYEGTITISNPTAGYFINKTGVYSENANYSLSETITLKENETIEVNCIGGTNTAIIATYDNVSYDAKVIGTSGTVADIYKYTAPEDCQVVISYLTATDPIVSKYINIKDVNDSLNDLIDDTFNGENPLYQFNKITAIGDSITEGAVWYDASHWRKAYRTWQNVLASIIGATETTYAKSGDTASQAWNRWSASLNDESKDNLFIIFLGTNSGLTDSLDIDAPENVPYMSWANTNTGCYAKFVAKCQELGGKVLLVPVYATGGDLAVTNQVIGEIGERFNVPVIDGVGNNNLIYHKYPDGTGQNMAHFNDLGYSYLGQKIFENCSKLTDEEKFELQINQ